MKILITLAGDFQPGWSWFVELVGVSKTQARDIIKVLRGNHDSRRITQAARAGPARASSLE